MKKISKIILCFVSTLEKHMQSNGFQDLFFEIHHIRTKYVYFLIRLNFDFSFFIKPWRNRLCSWTISQERVDLDCNFWGSLPFKLTTVGEVWWPLQLLTYLGKWNEINHLSSSIPKTVKCFLLLSQIQVKQNDQMKCSSIPKNRYNSQNLVYDQFLIFPVCFILSACVLVTSILSGQRILWIDWLNGAGKNFSANQSK